MEREVRLGYESRLRGLQGPGEVHVSLSSSRYLGDDQGYDPSTYWSQGARGHDGLTFSEEEREDWKVSLEEMTGEVERADWRRLLDDMVSDGWRVVRMGISTQAPVRPRNEVPWEPQRGFSGTSRVREDCTDSDGSF